MSIFLRAKYSNFPPFQNNWVLLAVSLNCSEVSVFAQRFLNRLYIKSRIAGVKFTTADQLFARLQTEWNNVPNEVIHNCYSSFLARCQVCVRIQGQNLNGHWGEVKKLHDIYRTRLQYFRNQYGQIFVQEVWIIE